ncbi:MAG: hybrid sensor histidine kinase/response regulator [Bryobacteraceae bacterium]|jgi:two-component system chemotaxis sensor kinase CheA
MSEPNLDDELVQDYLAECREHLATIETDLLAIEQGGAEIDEELVNRVFRAAHSIKGGAGFFDLAKIRELGHKTESALDLIRSRQMAPTPEVISILLMAFDKLRDLIDHYRESNQANIGEFVEALTALATGSLPENEKGSLSKQVTVQLPTNKHIQMSAFDLNQARKGSKCVYLVEYDLIHDIERRGKTPWGVFSDLIKCGAILETAFDLDSAGTLDDEPSNTLMLEVLYATVLEPDLVGQVVDVPLERVWLIEKNGAVMPLARAAPAPAAEPVAAAVAAKPPRKKKAANPAAKVHPRVLPAPPVPAKPAPGPARPPTPAEESSRAAAAEAVPAIETTIRLNVTLLDSLMTLAGELVLSRNQLNESLSRQDDRGIRSGAQRVSLVTSELQEVVTLTRMQPVGSLFAKFPRLVRDLARDLAKDVQLKIEGGEVEIDKTILEGLSDPLTHMVRNAVDHGVEAPAQRTAAGKPATGTVTLKASHQAGQVVIEISDDGKGLAADKIVASSVAKGLVTREQVQNMSDREKMALIFLPGVSTAEKVSDVSGRGVGMDVVKTNLDRLGGKIEIDSEPGRGSHFRIKLPLTLAIIPSLLVSDGGEGFAIPQVSVGELIRIPAAQLAERTDRVGDAQVLNVRDRLVPLLHLADALGVPRPGNSSRALNVVLVDTGAFEYGLVVEELHDTVEIVVKPLGRHLKGLHDYAGATILGDGRVAVILDVGGLATRAKLTAGTVEAAARQDAGRSAASGEMHALLLFQNSPGENCAVPIEQVSRIERVRPAQILDLGGRRTMQYCGASLPLVSLHDTAAVGELTAEQQWVVIVFERLGRPLGLLAAEPLDMVEAALNIDTVTLRQRGIAGSAVLKDRTILLLDIFELADAVRPEGGQSAAVVTVRDKPETAPTVLVADDSEFFRGQIQRLVEAVGCRVLAAEDGQAAWEILDHHAGEVDLVATDIEMPRLDGLALTRQIRADRRFAGLPVIALSSLAGEEEIACGMAAGVDEYQIKLNKEELMESIRKAVGRKQSPVTA